jgi:hypothetical protein
MLTISTSGTTPAASYPTIVIHGVGGGQMHDASVSLTINAAGGGGGLPLAITPTSATVPTGSQTTFGATGGTGPYSFTVVSGVGSINASTGVYTAGGTPGTATVRVTDGLGAMVEAPVTVTVVAGGVAVSLDGRALSAFGPAQTFSVFATSSSLAVTGLSTDRVQELTLTPTPGAYTLIAGAVSMNFTVTAACTITLP